MRGNGIGVLACVLCASAAGCSSGDDKSNTSVDVNSPSASDSAETPQIEWPLEIDDTFVVEADFTPLTLDDFRTFPESKIGRAHV